MLRFLFISQETQDVTIENPGLQFDETDAASPLLHSEAGASRVEACSGAHRRAREIRQQDHRIRFLRSTSVKPFVRRHKNDMADGDGPDTKHC